MRLHAQRGEFRGEVGVGPEHEERVGDFQRLRFRVDGIIFAVGKGRAAGLRNLQHQFRRGARGYRRWSEGEGNFLAEPWLDVQRLRIAGDFRAVDLQAPGEGQRVFAEGIVEHLYRAGGGLAGEKAGVVFAREGRQWFGRR